MRSTAPKRVILGVIQYQKDGKGDVYLLLFDCLLPLKNSGEEEGEGGGRGPWVWYTEVA